MDRTLRGYTIDSHHSSDLDDALYVTRLESGWDVLVCIADVASVVAAGSDEDILARQRAETTYGGQRIRQAMLSAQTLHALSLTPRLEHPCVAIHVRLNDDLAIVESSIERGTFRSIYRLAYDDVPRLLQSASEHGEVMRAAYDLARSLFRKRMSAGGFIVFEPDSKWNRDLSQMTPEHLDIAGYAVVSEMMILTNYAAALTLREQNLVGIYRNHDSVRNDQAGTERVIAALRAGDLEELGRLRREVGHILDLAYYSPECRGHFALGLDAYCHFTSPLRRYADLVNQRVLLEGAAISHPQELAQYLTSRHREIRERKEAAIRLEMDTRVRCALETGTMHTFAGREFTRIVKAVCEGSTPLPAFEAECLQRLAEGRLEPLDLACIFFSEEGVSATLGHAAAEFVLQHPEHAPSIWNVGLSRFKQQPPDLQILPDTVYTAVATLNGWRAEVTLPNKKQAAQIALARILAQSVEMPEGAIERTPITQITIARNAKNLLQEICQKLGLPIPTYETHNISTTMAPCFESVAQMTLPDGSIRYSTPAVGHSITNAEVAAAANLLPHVQHLAILPAPPNEQQPNLVGLLNEYAQAYRLPLPAYTFEEIAPGRFSVTAILCDGDRQVSVQAEGLGKSAAKQAGAAALAKALAHNPLFTEFASKRGA